MYLRIAIRNQPLCRDRFLVIRWKMGGRMKAFCITFGGYNINWPAWKTGRNGISSNFNPKNSQFFKCFRIRDSRTTWISWNHLLMVKNFPETFSHAASQESIEEWTLISLTLLKNYLQQIKFTTIENTWMSFRPSATRNRDFHKRQTNLMTPSEEKKCRLDIGWAMVKNGDKYLQYLTQKQKQ